MRNFNEVGALRAYLRGVRTEGKIVGFVPTMGALHHGHFSLLQRAKNECDIAVVSVFVNPTQFSPNEDFAAYPRDLNKDSQLCAHAGVDAIFAPSSEEIYPQGFQTYVECGEISQALEGARRPNHFRGVATVVTKLLNIVQPNIAYFGQKDYQQFLVIERMARDLAMNATIQMAATARDTDGLALSSRNAYLTPEGRLLAPALYHALQSAAQAVAEGASDGRELQRELEAQIDAIAGIQRDYLALVHPDTLEPQADLSQGTTLAVGAIYIGKTRLIDNLLIAPPNAPAPRLRQYKPL